MKKRSARSRKRSRRAKVVLTARDRKRLVTSSAGLRRSASATMRVASRMRVLASRDRLGNFEIQRLMSVFNQAESLASSTMRKADDAMTQVIRRI
jgi:hypothetical protein